MVINSIKFNNINIDFVKSYLRIDSDFTEDDEELKLFMQSAKSYILNYLNFTDEEIEGINPELNIAFLMLVSHFYENKTAVGTNKNIDLFLNQILAMHRSYL